jgi:hypothetical protein
VHVERGNVCCQGTERGALLKRENHLEAVNWRPGSFCQSVHERRDLSFAYDVNFYTDTYLELDGNTWVEHILHLLLSLFLVHGPSFVVAFVVKSSGPKAAVFKTRDTEVDAFIE